MKVLILGEKGFVGKTIYRKIKQSAIIEPLVLRELCKDGSERVTRKNIGLVAGEIIGNKVKIIINATNGYASKDNPPLKLIERVIKTASDHILIIHLGSSAEYGLRKVNEKIREDCNTTPDTEYGRLKDGEVKKLRSISRDGNCSVLVFRIFNIVGELEKQNTFLGDIYRQIYNAKEKLIRLNEIGHIRDFIGIDDIAETVYRTIVNYEAFRKEGFDIINLASGKPISQTEIVEKIRETFQGDYLWQYEVLNYERITYSVADIEKLNNKGLASEAQSMSYLLNKFFSKKKVKE